MFIQKNYSFFWKIDYRPGLCSGKDESICIFQVNLMPDYLLVGWLHCHLSSDQKLDAPWHVKESYSLSGRKICLSTCVECVSLFLLLTKARGGIFQG